MHKTPVEKLADVARLLRHNLANGFGPHADTQTALEMVEAMLGSSNVRAALGEVRRPLTLENWLEPIRRGQANPVKCGAGVGRKGI